VNGRGTPGRRSAVAPPATTAAGREAPTGGALQLALAALWLLDAVLQFQTFMFTEGFPRMLAATAAGNPGPVAGPVTGSAHLIGTHPPAATAVFGTRATAARAGDRLAATVRPALAAHGPPCPGGLDRLGPGRLVARRGTRRGAHRRGKPGHRRARRGAAVRAGRRAAVATPAGGRPAGRTGPGEWPARTGTVRGGRRGEGARGARCRSCCGRPGVVRRAGRPRSRPAAGRGPGGWI
jgi:hypothetical protein